MLFGLITGVLKTISFFLRARSSLSSNWYLSVTVRAFFKCLVAVRVFISDRRGPDGMPENVLFSGGRAGAGCGAGQGESVSLLAKTLPLLLGEASYWKLYLDSLAQMLAQNMSRACCSYKLWV